MPICEITKEFNFNQLDNVLFTFLMITLTYSEFSEIFNQARHILQLLYF